MPTTRHNDARRRVVEELPDLQDCLRHGCGDKLATYLAHRVVYFEMRQELFERLYFLPQKEGSVPSTPLRDVHEERVSSFTFLAAEPVPETPGCLNMAVILQRRQDGLLGLVSRTPVPLLVTFVVELGTHLVYAWMYVVIDYLRRSKLNNEAASMLDDDWEALKSTCESLMREARSHVTARTQTPGPGRPAQNRSLTGLSLGDCDDADRRLQEALKVAQVLVLKVNSATTEEMARYALRVMGDAPPREVVEERRDLSMPPPACRTAAASPQTEYGSDGEPGHGRGGVKIGGVRFGGSGGARGRSASPRSRHDDSKAKADGGRRVPGASPRPPSPQARSGDAEHGDGEHHHHRPAWKKGMRAVGKFLGTGTPSSSKHASSSTPGR